MRHVLSIVVLLLAGRVAAAGTVNISEVLYDWPSSDDGKVFVELYGPAGHSLDGYSLVGVNGSNGSTTHSVDLTGSAIPSDGFFVLADRTGGGTTFVANADLTDRNFDLQNGPDSVRLLCGTDVIDALGYGSFGSSHHFAGEGSAAPGASAGRSLARRYADVDTDDNRKDFVVLANPTPGSGPLAPASDPTTGGGSGGVVAAPTPSAAALGLAGCGLLLAGAVVRRRRRRRGWPFA